MFKGITTVLFDMDGTLLDSMSVWSDIDAQFFGENDFNIEYDAVKKEIEGKSMYETALYFIENFDIKKQPQELMDHWNALAYEHYLKLVSEKPGASSFVKKLKENGYKLGIASSNSMELIKAGLKNVGISDCFDAVVTANDVKSGKPSPDVYLKAASLIGVQPSECLVFEDVLAGVLAGKNAGMRTCVIYDDYSKNDWEEKKHLADYSINDYYEVLNLINE